MRFLVTDNGTIALQRADRQDLMNHGSILPVQRLETLKRSKRAQKKSPPVLEDFAGESSRGDVTFAQAVSRAVQEQRASIELAST